MQGEHSFIQDAKATMRLYTPVRTVERRDSRKPQLLEQELLQFLCGYWNCTHICIISVCVIRHQLPPNYLTGWWMTKEEEVCTDIVQIWLQFQ